MEKILVCGAGGHGKVVIDAIEREEKRKILGVIDDNANLHGKDYYGYEVIGGFDRLDGNAYKDCRFILAIARNNIRRILQRRLESLDYEFVSIIHPSALIAKGVSIGPGSMIMANTVINPSAKIGTSVVVNTGAIIEHDCVIDDFTHIGPGVHLAGAVSVGAGSFVGIGASVIEFIKIGSSSIIGAGAVVVDDVPDNVTAVGVPARILKRTNSHEYSHS